VVRYFHTNNENKDYDTNVTVEVTTNSGDLALSVSSQFEEFDDNSNHTYDLDVYDPGAQKRNFLDGGSTKIIIQPVGNDTWQFNYRVTLYFEDGDRLNSGANNLELNEENKESSDFPITQ